MTQPLSNMIDQLLRTGLLTDSEVTQICDNSSVELRTLDADQLLQQLLASGRLTPFQADEIAAGRGSQLVMNKYILLSRLGQGGMGTVYKALHTRMQRVVALKTLKPEASSPAFIERFYREVRAAARLNHPHAVAAYDADECETGHFLVMEFVDGEDLSARIKRDGPLPVSETITAIRQAAEALAYAHRFGIVHRDIKPANLMRDANGAVKVADLGLARLSGDVPGGSSDGGIAQQAGLTQAGTSLGTVDYMPPEQALDAASVDARADIYSLGCTLYYLLAGQQVYGGETLIARLLAHREAPIPDLPASIAEASPKLNHLFHRMVAKRPEDRCESMEEVAETLRELKEPADAAPDMTCGELTVFVIEPSAFQAKVVCKYLLDSGVDDIHLFHSVSETLAAVGALRPEAIVTSQQLPDGTGIELLQRLRDDLRSSRMPVVLLSGDPLSQDQLACIGSFPAVALLPKPFGRAQLNAALQQTVSESRSQPARISGLSNLRVLIVDDSSVARRRIEKTLSEIGFTRFTHADDGRPAMELIAQRTFELIVSDYNMPEMNGAELVAWIRQSSSHSHVPVIMCTTEFDPMKLAAVYQLGVSAICNKSFETELVRNIVVRLFK